MSTITQVSHYAGYLSMVRNISQNQDSLDQLQAQLATQRKATNLQAYGPQTQELLNLRVAQVQRQTFMQNIDTATPRLKAYDKVLTRLGDMTDDLTASAVFPSGPGAVRISDVTNTDDKKMKVSVNAELSRFAQDATYTVTAVPSNKNPNAFDITVTDGLGGSSVQTLQLLPVPPADGYRHNFKMTGGPGDGAVLSLNFDKIATSSSSSFKVSYPDLVSTRERIDGAFREIRALLNERVGDRYIFSGSRLNTEPVTDLTPVKQVTRVTLNGAVGEAGETYDLEVNGRRFSYTTRGLDATEPEASLNEIARNLVDQVNGSYPELPVFASVGEGNVITLTARNVGEKFTVNANVVNKLETLNSTSNLATLQPATTTDTQLSQLQFKGPGIDIGDRFGFKVAFGMRGRSDYQEYEVGYQITAQNIHSMPCVSPMDMATTRLAEQINTTTNPTLPFIARVAGEPGNLRLEVEAREPNKPFEIIPQNINGNIHNSMTVVNVPSGAISPELITDQFQGPVTEPYLPDYDSEFTRIFAERPHPAAWNKASMTIDEGLELSYGVTSTDPAIQKLVQAFRLARSAVDNPGHYPELMSQTKTLLAEAKTELRSLHSTVAVNLSTMENVRDQHDSAMADVINRIAKIEGVDQAEVAARLQNKMNTLEATYVVSARASKLSLINYLT